MVAFVACACEGRRPEATSAPDGAASTERGLVVARVGETPITMEQVRRQMAERGIDARRALDELVRREWLAAEAARRGYDRAPEVERVARQAAVQALLAAEVERVVGPDAIADEELRAIWEARRRELSPPESRASVHVLVRIASDADAPTRARARRLCESLVEELRAATDPVTAALSLGGVEREGWRLHAEPVPPLARDDDAEAAYLQALFAQPEPGLVPQPVETGYGCHAVVLTAIHPAAERSFDDVVDILRAERLVEKRRARLEALLAQLRARDRPRLDEARVRALLAVDPFARSEP
ncbi:MAG: peptidylprolyl isomerase [Myxococcota bacterium]|nr:peptidylprolyl isomerase [Myxococcota bacterium]MDW8361915.1 peptidyl-prolyl cis-trans isomerase [Myxococcales bacterium]